MKRTVGFRLLILLATQSFLAAKSFGASSKYKISIIQPPGDSGYTNVTSINDAGEICGSFDGSAEPFTYKSGAYYVLSQKQFNGDSLTELNNLGNGVGYDTQSNSPVYWNGSKFSTLAAPRTFAESSCTAEGLNDHGEVVGLSGGQAFENGILVAYATPIMWRNGEPSVLPTLGGKGVNGAVGVNDDGEIVGTSVTTGGIDEPVAWINGKIKALGTLGGQAGTAVDVNTSGVITGTAFTASGALHGFEWINGQMTDLGQVFAVKAIDDAGDVVGDANNSATMWVNGKPIDLNTLLPANSGWHLNEAEDINDHGQIVGIGTSHGQEEACLVNAQNGAIAALPGTLIPEPADLCLFALPAAMVAAARRRKRIAH